MQKEETPQVGGEGGEWVGRAKHCALQGLGLKAFRVLEYRASVLLWGLLLKGTGLKQMFTRFTSWFLQILYATTHHLQLQSVRWQEGMSLRE